MRQRLPGPSPSSVMMGASARSDAATENCKHAQPDVQPRLQVGAVFKSAAKKSSTESTGQQRSAPEPELGIAVYFSSE